MGTPIFFNYKTVLLIDNSLIIKNFDQIFRVADMPNSGVGRGIFYNVFLPFITSLTGICLDTLPDLLTKVENYLRYSIRELLE